MKLNAKEKEMLLHAVRDFTDTFGPAGPGPKPKMYANYAKQLVFAAPKIERGTMPENAEQSIAVVVAFEWFVKNMPDVPKDFLDFLSALQAFTVTNQFRD